MKTFDNVAKLKLATLTAGQFVETGGYYTKGGGGAAKYLIVAPQAADGYGDHVLANGNVAALQIKEAVIHSHLGVIADGDRTNRTIGTDNSSALNHGFSLSYDLKKDSILPAGAIRHTGPLIMQKAGAEAFGVRSSGRGADARTSLMFDADVTIAANKDQCKTLGANMEFHDIAFFHADDDKNNDTSNFYHTRDNINTKQDIDMKFYNCLFSNAEYAATTLGRGWWCFGSDLTGLRNGLRIDWPAGFDGSGLLPEQQLTTGMRGYRLQRNKIHASNGFLIHNKGYNRKNANNIQVQNNNIDTGIGLLKGSARDSSFDDNICNYATNVDFFELGSDALDDKVQDVTARNTYNGVNTADMQSPFNSLVVNIASVIDGLDFSGSVVGHNERTLFANVGGSVYGLKLNDIQFTDILRGNDTAATRYIFDEGGSTLGDIQFMGNSIKGYSRAFNPTSLFNVSAGNQAVIKEHSNTLDVATVPILPTPLSGLLSNVHAFSYTGDGSDPKTVFTGSANRVIQAAIVSERFGGTVADKTFMANGEGSSSDPFYLSGSNFSLSAKGDFNTNAAVYQVTIIY